jgi:uncharacterized membrane protein (DUF106 family)
MMGIFDAGGPLLAWVDGLAAGMIPAAIRLVLWGLLCGLISMLLYRWLSDQDRISRSKGELKTAQQALNAFDGEFKEAWPLMRRLMRMSLEQVGRVGWPAVVASLPLLFVLSWMSVSYGYHYPPPGSTPRIETYPAGLNARWVTPMPANRKATPHIVVTDGAGRTIATVNMKSPTPVIAKHRWWNAFIGNPSGYLPDHGQAERLHIPLPPIQYLPVGPGWMRGWEIPFFVSLVAVSLLLKRVMRIA